MKDIATVVGTLSVIMAGFLGRHLFFEFEHRYYSVFYAIGLARFSFIGLAVLSLWFLVSGLYLVIQSFSNLSKKGKAVFVLNGITWLSLALSIAIPNFFRLRVTSSGNACINNLRQIDAAAMQFALEKGLTNGMPIHFPDDLTPYIKLNSAGKIPPCPKGGVYQITKVGELPTCTFSTATPAHKLR